MNDNAKLKPLPRLSTDEEADLTEYDLSGFTPMRFEVEKKSARVTSICGFRNRC